MLQFELPLWSVHVIYQLVHWLRTCYSLMVPIDACIVRILVILWKESLYIDFGRTNPILRSELQVLLAMRKMQSLTVLL